MAARARRRRILAGLGLLAAAFLGACDYLGPPPAPIAPQQAVRATSASPVAAEIAHHREGLTRLQQSLDQQTLHRQELARERKAAESAYQAMAASLVPGGESQNARDSMAELRRQNEALGALANDAANNAAFADYLLDAIAALKSKTGLADRDRHRLSDLGKEARRAKIAAGDLLTGLKSDLGQSTAFIGAAEARLESLGLAASRPQSRLISETAAPPFAGAAGRRPLATIRFLTLNPAYEKDLRAAVTRTLALRPQAAFDILALSPTGASPLEAAQMRQNANRIVALLIDMGLAPSRIAIAQSADPEIDHGEIRLFVR